ncbi:MAG: hypothetical protein KDE68_01380 [Rhodocyclaceae bacterium]|nr:hypothetical protein [Rhodocyclaceae bacterium]
MTRFSRIAAGVAWTAVVAIGSRVLEVTGEQVWIVALLVGAGWWAFGGMRDEAVRVPADGAAADERRDDFLAAVEQCVGEFDRQFLAIDAECERVDKVLADAIEQLSASFHALHARAAQSHDGTDGDLSATAGEMDAELRQAVTALQFQDMASQLIGHVGHRLGGMRAALAELGAVMQSAPQARDEAAFDALSAQARQVCQSLHALSAMGASNPVKHANNVASGAVELF